MIFFLLARLAVISTGKRIAGQKDLSFDVKDLSHLCFTCLCMLSVTDSGDYKRESIALFTQSHPAIFNQFSAVTSSSIGRPVGQSVYKNANVCMQLL